MNLTLQEQLKELAKRRPELEPKKKKRRKNPQKRCTEHLSESDIRILMETNKRTLRRGKGGAWK